MNAANINLACPGSKITDEPVFLSFFLVTTNLKVSHVSTIDLKSALAGFERQFVFIAGYDSLRKRTSFHAILKLPLNRFEPVFAVFDAGCVFSTAVFSSRVGTERGSFKQRRLFRDSKS